MNYNEITSVLLNEDEQKKMVLPTRKMGRFIKIGICTVGITIVTGIISLLLSGKSNIARTPLLSASSEIDGINNIFFDKKAHTIIFSDKENGSPYLKIFSPYNILHSLTPPHNTFCHGQNNLSTFDPKHFDSTFIKSNQQQYPKKCMSFDNDRHLALYEDKVDNMSCYSIHWYTTKINEEIINCIKIDDNNWYGAGGLSVHRWPLNRANVPMQPFLTRRNVLSEHTTDANFDSFIEPTFFSSNGVAVIVDDYLPLFVSIDSRRTNDKKICLKSAVQGPYDHPLNSNSFGKNNVLKYQICRDQTAKSIHRKLIKSKYIMYPQESPSYEILQKPVWSTRGRILKTINQTFILSFIRNIKSVYNLSYSMMLIDGNYSRASGNYYFHEERFSHSHQLIMELLSDKEKNPLLIGTQVFPYVPIEQHQYSIHKNVSKPHTPFLLDITNKEALQWYKKHLMDVKSQVNVAGFRFSGGHAFNFYKSLQSKHLKTKSSLLSWNDFTRTYSKIAGEIGGSSFLGSGYKSQQNTVVADAGPMASLWSHNKGLKSIIPTVLTYGLLGYPFVLAGPIGGIVSYSRGVFKVKAKQSSLPSKELFIRWLQISAHLPVMEFSTGPWEYSEQVTNYTRQILMHRQEVFWPKYMSKAVSESTQTGVPVVRPLWWAAPHDKTAQFIDCEFLLGRDLLVSPVLFDKARKRDVYLPEGSWWADQLRGKLYKGGQWLHGYSVGLYEIPTFLRSPPPSSVKFQHS